MRPNILVLGYKRNWQTASPQSLEDYVGILQYGHAGSSTPQGRRHPVVAPWLGAGTLRPRAQGPAGLAVLPDMSRPPLIAFSSLLPATPSISSTACA